MKNRHICRSTLKAPTWRKPSSEKQSMKDWLVILVLSIDFFFRLWAKPAAERSERAWQWFESRKVCFVSRNRSAAALDNRVVQLAPQRLPWQTSYYSFKLCSPLYDGFYVDLAYALADLNELANHEIRVFDSCPQTLWYCWICFHTATKVQCDAVWQQYFPK